MVRENNDGKQIQKQHRTIWSSWKEKKKQKKLEVNIKHIVFLWSQTIINYKMQH